MKMEEIITQLEILAPPSLQEGYDNAGLITGNPSAECTGAIISLDATEEVIMEAVANKCNLVISHHPIVFGGLRKITGSNYVEKAVIAAIKNDIGLYAIHTNLDNVYHGVNKMMADKLGLEKRKVLLPKKGVLKKLFVYVPGQYAPKLRTALFAAGAGNIGNYSECSFSSMGTGTFKGNKDTAPFIGVPGKFEETPEVKIEMVFPAYLERQIIAAMFANHPYNEVAYDIISLDNHFAAVGTGLEGELPEAMNEKDFLQLIRKAFEVPVVRHTALMNRQVKKVALCGGAGSFLISNALAAKADFFITADLKYHEFFDANGRMVVADIGHFESEQFTINLLAGFLQEKFPTFAALKTAVKTNPVNYYL
jgi:dinuclear metal center YbgI/SA1388 family protein